MKKIKKFLSEWFDVHVEWETPFSGGAFKFSLLHIIILAAFLIWLWVKF